MKRLEAKVCKEMLKRKGHEDRSWTSLLRNLERENPP